MYIYIYIYTHMILSLSLCIHIYIYIYISFNQENGCEIGQYHQDKHHGLFMHQSIEYLVERWSRQTNWEALVLVLWLLPFTGHPHLSAVPLSPHPLIPSSPGPPVLFGEGCLRTPSHHPGDRHIYIYIYNISLSLYIYIYIYIYIHRTYICM